MKPRTNAFERPSAKTPGNPDSKSNIGVILLLGPPGVGKGTQAISLSKVWGIPCISTGELLRSNVAKSMHLGREIREIMNRGELVPDSLINEMVASRIGEPDTARGYILDGFPRTLDQAIWLTERVTAPLVVHPIFAVRIHVGQSQLLRRITGRRHCPRCQATFNIYENRPRNEGFCDRDATALIHRPDDEEEILKTRLRLHDALTEPVIEHFKTHGLFVEVSGDGPIEWITQRILGAHELLTTALRARESHPVINEEHEP